MALNLKTTTDANNRVVSISNQEGEIEKGYRDYIAKNPEPNPDNIRIESAQPNTTATTGASTTGETASETTPTRIFDSHYSPQWILDEQQKRLNPEYVSELSDDIIDPNTFDMLANYVKAKKDANPDLWKYGDPGWSSDDPAWTLAFQPLEEAYQQQQRANQIAAPQQAQDDAVARVNAKYKNLQVDTSGADYNKEQWDEKLFTRFTPGVAGTDIANAPESAKYTQNLIGSYVSSSGPARIIKYAAAAAGLPGVGIIAGVTHFALFAYNYEKARGNIKGNKVIDKVLELTDIMDTKSQQFQGSLAYAAEKIGIDDLSNWKDSFTNTKAIIDNFGDFVHYAFGSGKASTEYDSDVVGMVTEKTANMGASPIIGNLGSRAVRSAASWIDLDGYWVDRNEVTRNNLGLTGTHELSEELIGSNAIITWLDYAQDLKDACLAAGMTMDDVEFLFNQKFTEVYGDEANLSEFIEHEWTDPGNTLENYESRVTGAYAKATHDINLQKAAESQYGSTMGTLTGNMKILPNVVREIGKLTGHDWWKTPGDLDQVLKAWDVQNLASTPEQLTDRDRRFSGISEDNTVDRFDPNKKTSEATTLVGKAVQGVKNFFSETNESRAMEEGDAIFDVIKVGVASALEKREGDGPESATNRVIDFLASLENPESIPETSPFYETSQSVIFQTVKDDLAQAVRERRTDIDKIIKAYQETEDNRMVLNNLAEALNMTPQKLLNMYENQKTVLTQMILNKARANGGTIPNIVLEDGTPIDVEGRAFGEKVIQMIKPFTGDDFVAWNPQQLVVQLSTDIADGVSSTIISKFGIEPDKFIYRLGNTVKTMQNLVLLGLSPSYLANNFVNNIVTRTALGYGGWMSPATIGNWMKRFGYSPDREKESFGPEIGQKSGMKTDSGYEKLRVSIRDKKRMKDGLDKISNFSSKASEKFGLFGNLSGKIESMESQQILAAAMMHYMNQTWKPGVNFRKMPVGLEAEIDRQMPGMSKAIYAAISKGINMEEIEDALFGSFVAPSVRDSLIEAARRKGSGDPDGIVTEYFVRSGMLNMMEQALRGKRGDEIQPIIDDFAKELQAMMEVQFSDVIAHQAEDIKNNVGWKGYVEAIRTANDAAEEMSKVWLASNDSNSRVFQRRVEEGMSTKAFRKLYQQHQDYLTDRWKNVYAKMVQTYDGILTGLGIGDKNREKYLKLLNDKNNLWAEFYEETQPQAIKPYLDSLKMRPGEKKTQWDSRVTKAWKDYQEDITKKVAHIRDRELTIQKQMDEAYMRGLKQVLGTAKASEVDTVLAPKFEAIRNKRKEISEQVNAIRENAKKVQMYSQKNEEWDIGNPMRVQLTKDLENLQKDLNNAIGDMNPFVQGKPAKDPTDGPDPAAHIIADVNHDKAVKEQKIAAKYSEKATNNIAKGKVKRDKTIATLKGQITRSEKTYKANFDKMQELRLQYFDTDPNDPNATEIMKQISKLNENNHKLWQRIIKMKEELNLRQNEMKAITPDKMKAELRKDNLRDVFREVGYGEGQADAVATLIEARANTVENKHPDTDFYKDKYNVQMEFVDEDRFVKKSGNSLHQVSFEDMTPTKTPEAVYQELTTAYPSSDLPEGTTYRDLIMLIDDFDAVLAEAQSTLGIMIDMEDTFDGAPSFFDQMIQDVYNDVKQEVGEDIYYEFMDDIDDNDSEVPEGSVALYQANKLNRLMESLQNAIYDYEDNANEAKKKIYDIFGIGKELSEDDQEALEWANPALDYKPETLILADTNTREFSDFYGDHPKMRTADNKPIIVYNTGSNSDIRHFDKSKRGYGAGGFDVSDVWYLNSSSIASGSYADDKTFSDNNPNYQKALRLLSDTVERKSYLYYEDAANSFKRANITDADLNEMVKEYREAIDALPIDGGHKSNLNTEFYDEVNAFKINLKDKYVSKMDIRDQWATIDSKFIAVVTTDALQDIANGEYKETWDFDKWFTKPYYVSLKNPLVVDMHGEEWELGKLNPYIDDAKLQGRDGLIIENIIDGGGIISTDYLVFDSNQIKSIYNEGPFSMKTDNIYLQAAQRIKGDFKVEDAMNIVKLFRGNDLSTLVHEVLGHGFAQTLDDDEVEALAQYNGWTVEEYRRLEDLWNHNGQMTPEERQAWINAQEKFAYGFEQYLMEGKTPNSAMAQVFETFKNYLIEIYKGVKHLIDTSGEEIDLDKEQNGVTLRQIFDSLLEDYDPEKIKEESRKKLRAQIEARKPESEAAFASGHYAPLSDIDLTAIDKTKGTREADVKVLAYDLYSRFKDEVAPAVSPTPTLDDWIKYINGYAEDGQPMLSSRQMQTMDFRIKSLDDPSIMDHVEALRNNIVNPNAIPEQGAYVVPTYAFECGKYEKIVAAVVNDGKIVAYVPSEMPLTEVQNGKETYRVVGVSPDDPELFVYVVGDEIRTQQRREDNKNPYYPELEENASIGSLDPVAEAHNELGYEELLPILQEFGDVYRQNLDKNMTDYKFSGLDADTRKLLRGYIDHDIRSDMMNTKYKTGKFGETMRDAALLNYNKRYGFDNFLTALFPYQFWMTRSFKNWLGRMDGKGSKMWRKYYKWKELEKRNKKDFMPSKITGKFGIPVPWMDDYLGDAQYMSTDQLFVVNQFLDPILNYGKNKNAVIAAAEKILQEAYDAGDIDHPTYLAAINPETREDMAEWQEALAKAELEDTSDRSFGGLVGDYLGFNLPISVSKALLTGDTTEWNQWPMTRTGTAFRAIVGNNWVGKLGERVLSAPERALRKAAVEEFGNAFEYNEFGSFGDYYMRNMVFDMVTEGRISAPDAVQACIEKDGNPIWEEAADRVRQETLIKMQGGSFIDAGKKLAKDVAEGNNDKIGGDFLYLLTALITSPMSKTVVHAAEPEWRKEKAGLSEAYKEGTQNEYYDEHPGVSYVNLRYESDPEKMLRQYLYKQINEKYYDLDPAERSQIDISFDPDFKKYVINKETRAIEAIDLNKLAGYAQALNGKVPFLATDKLNTMNIPQMPIVQVPQTTLDHYNEYRKIRDEQWPGMAKANQIYYDLPAEDRKLFSQANPNLKLYQDWDKDYKNAHEDVKQYSKLISDSYDIAEMENACYLLDNTTMKYLTMAAYGDGKLGAEFKPGIEAVMQQVGSTDKYDYFVKNLMKYIRSE